MIQEQIVNSSKIWQNILLVQSILWLVFNMVDLTIYESFI